MKVNFYGKDVYLLNSILNRKDTGLNKKLYILCDFETNFILHFSVNTSASDYKDLLEDQFGKSGVIVKNLIYIKTIFFVWLFIYTDNFYTSSSLAIYLRRKKINSCGTVRKNRKLMSDLQSKLKLGKKESMCTDKLLAIPMVLNLFRTTEHL